MLRMGVPVATPLSLGDWLAGLSTIGGSPKSFEKHVSDFLDAPHVWSTSSGRAAIYLALSAMRELSARHEVIVPAFVCPSVARAVIKAGLKPVLCDVSRSGSGLDHSECEALLNRSTLAVIAADLYGYPCDNRTVKELAHAAGAMFLEDASQAFGAKWGGRYSGAQGDAGVFSFGPSKVLGASSAGLLVVGNTKLRPSVERCMADAGRSSMLSEAFSLVKTGVFAMATRSNRLGPLAAVWGGLLRGRTDCSDFAVCRCTGSQAAIVQALLLRFTEITGRRRHNAEYLQSELSSLNGPCDAYELPEVPAEAEPVYLRFPVVVRNANLKNSVIHALLANGINASEMYTRTSYLALRNMASVPRACPRAEYLVDRMVDLPTHCYLTRRDLAKAVSVFADAMTSCNCLTRMSA